MPVNNSEPACHAKRAWRLRAHTGSISISESACTALVASDTRYDKLSLLLQPAAWVDLAPLCGGFCVGNCTCQGPCTACMPQDWRLCATHIHELACTIAHTNARLIVMRQHTPPKHILVEAHKSSPPHADAAVAAAGYACYSAVIAAPPPSLCHRHLQRMNGPS